MFDRHFLFFLSFFLSLQFRPMYLLIDEGGDMYDEKMMLKDDVFVAFSFSSWVAASMAFIFIFLFFFLLLFFSFV